ncbi:MAG TPA: enoyl-CoA hydratase-related protein [Gaiellaceae bacterium]|nr:enoyl-CoA hydratase-related protein [Gaiellaceae bacterium]
MNVEGLTIEQAGAVLRAHVDAGPGNLFTPSMTKQLTAVLRTPPKGAHVLHLSAAGPDFCMGRAPFRNGAGPLREDVDGLVDIVEALERSRMVTVAEVQGDAAGFGVGLVALSDVAVAAPGVHLSFPEVDEGFAPALVLAWLGRVVGRRQAFWLAATGVRLPAPEALEIDLLTHVVDDPDALSETVATVVELLCSKPPAVHAQIKDMLRLYASVPEDARGKIAADRLAFGALRRALAE